MRTPDATRSRCCCTSSCSSACSHPRWRPALRSGRGARVLRRYAVSRSSGVSWHRTRAWRQQDHLAGRAPYNSRGTHRDSRKRGPIAHAIEHEIELDAITTRGDDSAARGLSAHRRLPRLNGCGPRAPRTCPSPAYGSRGTEESEPFPACIRTWSSTARTSLAGRWP